MTSTVRHPKLPSLVVKIQNPAPTISSASGGSQSEQALGPACQPRWLRQVGRQRCVFLRTPLAKSSGIWREDDRQWGLSEHLRSHFLEKTERSADVQTMEKPHRNPGQGSALYTTSLLIFLKWWKTSGQSQGYYRVGLIKWKTPNQ